MNTDISPITNTPCNASTEWGDDEGIHFRAELHDDAARLLRRTSLGWELAAICRMTKTGFFDLSRAPVHFREQVKFLHRVLREEAASKAEGRPNRHEMESERFWARIERLEARSRREYA